MRTLVLLTILLAAVRADTVILKSGLELHGVVTDKGAKIELAYGGRTHLIDRAAIRSIQTGESLQETYAARAAALGDTDAAGWYRLGLWAREKKLGRAREAFEQVVRIDPDHRAARRELGFERVDGAWLSGAEAMHKKGFVLAGGRWMLPAEADRLMRAGLVKQAPVTKELRRRAAEIVQALQEDDQEVRTLAAEMVPELPDAALLRPMRKLLLAPFAETRLLAVKTLGRIGDRAALPWLIRTSMFDAKAEVRDAAYRAVKGFEDSDVFFPYARALFSKSPVSRVQAARALAELGDLRGVNVILRRVSIGIGAAPRVNLLVGRQQSYIQDFDVEIAQAAAIGDPIVQTIRDGTILDFKVLGGYGEAWVVQERNAYAKALERLTCRDYGTDWKAYAKYAEAHDLPKVALR